MVGNLPNKVPGTENSPWQWLLASPTLADVVECLEANPHSLGPKAQPAQDNLPNLFSSSPQCTHRQLPPATSSMNWLSLFGPLKPLTGSLALGSSCLGLPSLALLPSQVPLPPGVSQIQPRAQSSGGPICPHTHHKMRVPSATLTSDRLAANWVNP